MPDIPNLPTQHGSMYALDGRTLEQLKRAFIKRIRGGRGIRVREFGQEVIIEADARAGVAVGGGGGGAAMVEIYDNYAAMAAANRPEGTLGLTRDRDCLYIRTDTDGWRVTNTFKGSMPSGVGEQAGDLWYGGPGLHVYTGAAGWLLISHLE